jgi:hypothetical protein
MLGTMQAAAFDNYEPQRVRGNVGNSGERACAAAPMTSIAKVNLVLEILEVNLW